MKRQRGRGRGGKPGGGGGGGGGHHHNQQHPNRQLESNGPETKVRGSASAIHERYLQLARDAASSGDRMLSENYLQHADHYFRLWRSMQPAVPIQQPQQDRFNEGEFEGGEEEGAPEDEAVEAAEGGGGDQPDVEFPANQQGDREPRGDGERRRGRGRRNRFRGEGEGDGAQARDDGGERREPREPRPPREPREPRGDREGGESREGFASGPGPKPAFLGSD